MNKTFLTRLYEKHRLLTAIFFGLVLVMAITVGTGFGLGALVTRTVTAADTAQSSQVSKAEEMIADTGQSNRTTALLVEGVDISNLQTAKTIGEIYSPFRTQLETELSLQSRNELLDPFLFNLETSEATNIPLIGNDGRSFILLIAPSTTRSPKELDKIEQRSKAVFEAFIPELKKAFPTSHAYLNSKLHVQEIAQHNTLWATSAIALLGWLLSAAGFYVSTRRPAAALSGSISVLASGLAGLFVAWVGTFIIAYPIHLVPVVVLSSITLGIIITAVLHTIDSHRLHRAGRLGRAVLVPDSGQTETLEEERAQQFAKRVWAARLILLISFLVPITTFLLAFAVPLLHVRIFALTMLVTTVIIWSLAVLIAPGLQLSLEHYFPSHADIDRPTGVMSKTEILNQSAKQKLGWFEKVEQYLNVTYLDTAFSKNMGAPAIAALILLVACLPWALLSPKASSAAELSNAQDIAYFQTFSEENYPSLHTPAFYVLSKSSPSQLQHWADQVASESTLLKVVSTATAVGNEKFSTINFDFQVSNPTYFQQSQAFNSLVAETSEFEHVIYSEMSRNIQAIDITIDSLLWLIPLMLLVAAAALYLLFGNLIMTIIQLVTGILMSAASIGLAILVSASGFLAFLPGVGFDVKLDVTGLVIGSFLSVVIISVILLEPHVMTRPATSRAVWLVVGAGSIVALFSGQLVAATIGLLLINTIIVTVIGTLLIVPQLLFIASKPDSQLHGRNAQIVKLHAYTRTYLHRLFEVAPRRARRQQRIDKLSNEPTNQPDTATVKEDDSLSATEKSRRMLSRVRSRQRTSLNRQEFNNSSAEESGAPTPKD